MWSLLNKNLIMSEIGLRDSGASLKKIKITLLKCWMPTDVFNSFLTAYVTSVDVFEHK